MKSLGELTILNLSIKDSDISILMSKELLDALKLASKKSKISVANIMRSALIEKLSSQNPFEFLPDAFIYEGLPGYRRHSIMINRELQDYIESTLKAEDIKFQSYARLSITEKIKRLETT